MASTYSSRLKLELMETGANANTWGTNTNNNLNVLDAFSAGYLSKSVAGSADVTLTTNNADPSAESSNKVIDLNGALTGDIKVLIPAAENQYTFFNNTSGSQTLTIAATGHTSNGVAITQGAKTTVYCDGTANFNVVAASSTDLGSLTGSLTGTTITNPAITGGSINNSTVGASTPTTGSFTTLAASSTVSGTGFTNLFASPPAIGGTAAAAGAFTTLSASSTVSGSGFDTLLTPYAKLSDYSTFVNATEKVTVSATAATGTINFDTGTQSVIYYTTNASGDWTINFRDSSGTTLNAKMATGESISLVHLVTIGGSEYRNTTVQVDGSSITPEWQGGSAPTEGNANSIDSYTYTIIKTGDAAFTILAALTQFA